MFRDSWPEEFEPYKSSEPVKYTVHIGASVIKGGKKTVAQALGDAINDVGKSIARGTIKSIQKNADIVFSTAAEYVKESMIQNFMTPNGQRGRRYMGLFAGDTKIGIWTGSFLQSLYCDVPVVTSTNASVSGQLEVSYDGNEQRYERSNALSGGSHGVRVIRNGGPVSRYGGYLFDRLKDSAGIGDDYLNNFFVNVVESVVDSFRHGYGEYSAYSWRDSPILHKAQREIAAMRAANQAAIEEVAYSRILQAQIAKEAKRRRKGESS